MKLNFFYKRFFIILMSIFAISCTSCDSKQNQIICNKDPELLSVEDRNIHQLLGISEDESYENIVIHSLKETYSTDDEKLTCVVTNENIGKGFYYYNIPFIEKNIDDNWVRLNNTTSNPEWYFCGADDKSVTNECHISTLFENIEPSLTNGEYRFVIFTAEKVLYTNFIIK